MSDSFDFAAARAEFAAIMGAAIAPAARPTADAATAEAEPPAIRPRFVTAGDLVTRNPRLRDPVIDGLLRRGEVGSLISGPKMQKSWALMAAAIAITQGANVFGFPTAPGRVLILDYELAPGTLAKRLTSVAGAMGYSLDEIGDLLCVESLRGRQLDIFQLGRYLAEMPARRFDLVIIDPMYRTFPAGFDENSNAAMAELFAALQRYAEKLDAGFLLTHHLSKGNQSDRGVSDLGAGAGAQSRAADCHLAIRPHAEDGAAVLAGVVRSFPPFEPIAMRWRFPLWMPADDLDPTELQRPSARRRKAAEAKSAEPAAPIRPEWETIAELLTDAPQPGAAIVAMAVQGGMSQRRAEKMLQHAEGLGLAHRWRVPKDRRTFFASQPQPELFEAEK